MVSPAIPRDKDFMSRLYPTTLVNPDGSTIEISYTSPRRIIKLPYDPQSASPELLARIKYLRLERGTVKQESEIKQSFDHSAYI